MHRLCRQSRAVSWQQFAAELTAAEQLISVKEWVARVRLWCRLGNVPMKGTLHLRVRLQPGEEEEQPETTREKLSSSAAGPTDDALLLLTERSEEALLIPLESTYDSQSTDASSCAPLRHYRRLQSCR